MEKQLFNFLDVDILDTAVFQFYEITLKQDIGDFSVGEEFDAVLMNYEKGTITLFRGDNKWKYKLTFLVESECKNSQRQ